MSDYGTPPDVPSPTSPRPTACSACGGESLEPGFIEDAGEGPGFARWIPGALERGLFGGARRMGRARFEVVAVRCTRCQHLDLFVGNGV